MTPAIEIDFEVRVEWQEIVNKLSPDQITALVVGLGLVAASNAREPQGGEGK